MDTSNATTLDLDARRADPFVGGQPPLSRLFHERLRGPHGIGIAGAGLIRRASQPVQVHLRRQRCGFIEVNFSGPRPLLRFGRQNLAAHFDVLLFQQDQLARASKARIAAQFVAIVLEDLKRP